MAEEDELTIETAHANFTLVPFAISGTDPFEEIKSRPISFAHRLSRDQVTFEPFAANKDRNMVAQRFEIRTGSPSVQVELKEIEGDEERSKNWAISPIVIHFDERVVKPYRNQNYVYLEEKVYFAFVVHLKDGVISNLLVTDGRVEKPVENLLMIATNIRKASSLVQYLDITINHLGLRNKLYSLTMDGQDLEQIDAEISSRRVRTSYRVDGQSGVEEVTVKGAQPQHIVTILVDAGLGVEEQRYDGYIVLPGGTEVYGLVTVNGGLHVKNKVPLQGPLALSLSSIIPRTRIESRITGSTSIQLLIEETRQDL